jgi:AcrR family transcriptional regulator
MLLSMAIGDKATTRPERMPPAERLLDTAASLFDREGIRAVGIERLIAAAGVARASLYQNFGSKDALVVAYLERADRADRARFAREVRDLADHPRERIRAVFVLAEAGAKRRGYRGCLYINAATEFPDAHHPVRGVVLEHRRWLLDELTHALDQAGVGEPPQLAARLQLIYDGALVGAKSARAVAPIRAAAELVEELIDAALTTDS